MGYRYNYKVHPLAELFPGLSAENFKKLKEDIGENGLIEPIVLDHTGEILLDGRHRLKACKELGIEPRVVKQWGREAEAKVLTAFARESLPPGIRVNLLFSDADYIWSVNVLRRHLTDDQRATIANKWSDTEKEAAKERQRQNLKRGDQKPEVADSPPRGKTRELLAKQAGVSQNKIRQAETVAKHKPELLPKIEAGELKLKDALKQTEQAKPQPRARKFEDDPLCVPVNQTLRSIEKVIVQERAHVPRNLIANFNAVVALRLRKLAFQLDAQDDKILDATELADVKSDDAELR